MNVDAVISAVKNYIPEDYDSLKLLEERVGKLSDEERDNFVSKILPQLGLITSRQVLTTHFFFGLFGYGRAIANDWVEAVIRLLALIFGSLLFFGIVDLWFSADRARRFGRGLLIIVAICWLMDFYLLGKKVRTENLEKILVWLEMPTTHGQGEKFLGK